MFTRIIDVTILPDEKSPHFRRKVLMRHIIVTLTSEEKLVKTFTPWSVIANGLEFREAFNCVCALLELNLPISIEETELFKESSDEEFTSE